MPGPLTTLAVNDPLLRDVPMIDGYKVLDPAVLVEKLPEGGMAAVYRGLHLDLKVEVAVKVLKRTGNEGYSPQAVARFRQEAEQAARLNDPNLVRIYDFPANRLNLLYLVMEYVDGETVEGRVHRKGWLSAHEAVTIALLATRGLSAAHAENVIHRDIKPPNILVSKRGHVKVADLGIAKAHDSAAVGMTQEVTILGTPQYMAPELWRGARFASAASDVFAMGATIAFMVTGRHLLDGQDVAEVMHRALSEGFPDVRLFREDLPQPLVELISAATASDPAHRPTVEQMLHHLRGMAAALGGEYPLADPAAGHRVAPLSPTRFPSRSDLELIRRHLDQKRARTEIPATLGIGPEGAPYDDPSTAVAALHTLRLQQQAAARANRPPDYDAVAVPDEPQMSHAYTPATAMHAAVALRRRRKSKAPLVLGAAVLAVAGMVAGVGLKLGWFGGGGANDNNGDKTTPVAAGTQPAAATQPDTRPATVTTGPADPPVVIGPPPTKPVTPPTQPVPPPTRPAVVTPPPVADVPTTFDDARRRLAAAAADGKWATALDLLATADRLAAAEGRRPELVSLADDQLMAFRAAHPDLDKRREAFPKLADMLAPPAAGGSCAARLVLAERTIGYAGTPPRAVGQAGDADLKSANEHLDAIAAAANCRPDVKQAAAGRSFDVRAAAVYQAAEAAASSPDKNWADAVLAALTRLADAPPAAGREREIGQLVDRALPPADARAAWPRVVLAEHRLKVIEDEQGFRKVTQADPAVLASVKALLLGARHALDARAAVRASALLGEVAQAGGNAAAAYNHYATALSGAKLVAAGDPVAAMGMARFQLTPRSALDAPEYADPTFDALRSTPSDQRTYDALLLVRKAAATGDPHANFMAGYYTWATQSHTATTRREVEGFLTTAAKQGHRAAAAQLERMKREG